MRNKPHNRNNSAQNGLSDIWTRTRPALLDVWAGVKTLGWVLWQLLRPLGQISWRGMSHWPFWKKTLLHGSSVGFAMMIALFLGLFMITRAHTPDPQTDLWSINRPPSVTLLDRQGELIGIRGSHYGDPVPVTELPDYVVASFVSTEDRRFYSHHGFDPRGFTRAILTNIRYRALREGGSTITQQLARSLFLSNERTLNRKLVELHLALWLEARYEKDELLSLYLNRTYLGSGAYGVEAAAQVYFGKSARELTLPEAALLAGLPKAPSTLSPTVNFEGAARRSVEVIDNLVETDIISPATAELAKMAPPILQLKNLNTDFGYVTDHALVRTADLLGGIETDIVITTTIDRTIQEYAASAVRAVMTEEAFDLGAEQAALIAYDNEGELLAMVGGRAYDDSQFNRATQAVRQPGSVFKPFVYLAALENGISTRTLFIDQPTEVEGWQPRNYTGTNRGPIRMTEAIAQSINSVAVQASEAVGRAEVVEAAQRLGITRDLQPHPSVALGAMAVTLEEITSAYLPFARSGLSASPYVISRIENRQGEVVYERALQPQQQLFDESVSRDMTHLMHQVMVSGTGRRARPGSRAAAGKTGTTNDWKDAWFVGYTAQMTAGVWVGNDENASMQEVTGGTLPASIWRSFMLAAHEGMENKSLPGAFAADAGSENVRQREFYAGLESDFDMATTVTAGASYAQARGDFGNSVTGTELPVAQTYPMDSDIPIARDTESDPEPAPQRPRWWPFRRRGE
ncbi:transglycosylase domain-containing protein [Parvularcula sp. IMCC14364]|uniref:transglycosylase domain-containing protein n=1 Tax=Parvularcula sp. IMCC14364 TaxID=3067902 RepID=UPI002741E7C5|nr:PBP1A family penicillin-binding protein [Parvularcula sp. IMCC14364]